MVDAIVIVKTKPVVRLAKLKKVQTRAKPRPLNLLKKHPLPSAVRVAVAIVDVVVNLTVSKQTTDAPAQEAVAEPVEAAAPEAEAPKKRGGRKPKAAVEATEAELPVAEPEAAPEKPKRKSRAKAAPAEENAPAEAPVADEAAEPAKPKRPARKSKAAAGDAKMTASAEAEAPAASDDGDNGGSPRQGWWQRTFG